MKGRENSNKKIIIDFFILLYGKLVHDEMEHSDWFPERVSGPNFAIRTAKMGRTANELISPNSFYETLNKKKLFSIK